jgi:hypothetical protein
VKYQLLRLIAPPLVMSCSILAAGLGVGHIAMACGIEWPLLAPASVSTHLFIGVPVLVTSVASFAFSVVALRAWAKLEAHEQQAPLRALFERADQILQEDRRVRHG